MTQEFNKVSTVSNLIKNLLISTYLPLIRTVRDYDYIIQDRLYIYKCEIIKCTKSGYIVTGYQYAHFDGDRAQYRVIEEYYFGERNDKLCTNYISNSEGYDSITHERLGKYLRSLRDMYDLNLMPLYNCFSNSILKGHRIKCKGNWASDKVYKTSEDDDVMVYKVPIRFNTDYTVCIENVGTTTFAPAFIRNNNLLKLNNSKFGNDVDVTNKYSKLYRTSVITSFTGMRFYDPVIIRYNNIPTTRTIYGEKTTTRTIDAIHTEDYYKKVTSEMAKRMKYYILNVGYYYVVNITGEEYNKNPFQYYYNDNGYLTQCTYIDEYDENRIYYILDELKNGNTYMPTDLTPEDTDEILYVGVEPSTGRGDTASPDEDKVYITYDEERRELTQWMTALDDTALTLEGRRLKVTVKGKQLFDGAGYETVSFIRRCTKDESYDSSGTYYILAGNTYEEWTYQITESEYYENRSQYYILSSEDYISCDEEDLAYDASETYYVLDVETYITVKEQQFKLDPTRFIVATGFPVSDHSIYYKIIDGELVQCGGNEQFDINTTYVQLAQKEYNPWQTWQDEYMNDTTDTYIVEGKTYYSKIKQVEYIPVTYDITEENCALYESIEDNLYMLIQVPKNYEGNIVVLEGDYTNTKSDKHIDDSQIDMLPRPLVDYLYQSHLKLMELPLKKVVPFSDTLVEFLLWNAINNLDSINNNMDRLILAIDKVTEEQLNVFGFTNYWYPSFRRIVYEVAKDYNNKYVVDNLGYVTKDIEQVIFTTRNNDSYINDYDVYIEEEEVY